MRLSDFDFDLPDELIAQRPSPERDRARLFVLPRAAGPSRRAGIADLPALLPPRSLLCVNDTRVLPARLQAEKPTGGRVELLVLEPQPGGGETPCLARAAKPLRPGAVLEVLGPDGARVGVRAEVVSRDAERASVRFDEDGLALLARAGALPLPPYIRRPADADDRERYQTVFAERPGAVAAPTAGLHFTPALLAACRAAGHEVAALTLHVGPGTFAPVRSDDVAGHVMHAERYDVPAATAAAVTGARRAGRAVIAVGTTVVRTLETAWQGGELRPGGGETRLFVTPGHAFAAVDGLLTNFHLPRSTLLMLVAALVGRERLLAAYDEAVRERFRFYSYGDAMLIV